jgi:hypothetical protein
MEPESPLSRLHQVILLEAPDVISSTFLEEV